MATLALPLPKAKQNVADKYVGERRNQLRHGYGVYTYDNKFFRYEGQWENGLKQGHGKLSMADGGYYEGTFREGEIEGHGLRVFGVSGSSYTGQFHGGEMHGQGLLRTASGAQYEGTWLHGRKEGNGIQSDGDGGIYEGEFHQGKRHGEGVQIYSDGGQYDGDWVAGKRHGQGMLRCADGTIYDGQWRGDVYHGEGSILHASGVRYKGMWSNGKPAVETVGLRLAGSNELVVEQGKSFSLEVLCVDSQGDIVEIESGRSFQVKAAVQKTRPTRLKRQATVIPLHYPTEGGDRGGGGGGGAGKGAEVIETPFGYSATPYELLQLPHTEGGSRDTPPPVSLCRPDDRLTTPTTDANRGTEDEVRATANPPGSSNLHCSSLSPSAIDSGQPRTSTIPDLSRLEAHSLHSMTNPSLEKSTSVEEEFLASLTAPSTVATANGKGTFKDLFFPPPPAPDVSHVLTPSPTKQSLAVSPGKRTKSTSPGRKSPSVARSHSTTPSSNASLKSSPSASRKQVKGQMSRRESEKVLSRVASEREKLLHPKRAKFCQLGTYVLVVSEVTDPPYLGTRLHPLYVQAKVVPHQKASREVSLEKLLRTKTKVKMMSK